MAIATGIVRQATTRTGSSAAERALAAFEQALPSHSPGLEDTASGLYQGNVVRPIEAALRPRVTAAFAALEQELPGMRAELGGVIGSHHLGEFDQLGIDAQGWKAAAQLQVLGLRKDPVYVRAPWKVRETLRKFALTSVAIRAAGGREAAAQAGGLQALQGARQLASDRVLQGSLERYRDAERQATALLEDLHSIPGSLLNDRQISVAFDELANTVWDANAWARIVDKQSVGPVEYALDRLFGVLGESDEFAVRGSGNHVAQRARLLDAALDVRAGVHAEVEELVVRASRPTELRRTMNMDFWSTGTDVASQRIAHALSSTDHLVASAASGSVAAERERLARLASSAGQLLVSADVLRATEAHGFTGGYGIDARQAIDAVIVRIEAMQASPQSNKLPRKVMDRIDSSLQSLRATTEREGAETVGDTIVEGHQLSTIVDGHQLSATAAALYRDLATIGKSGTRTPLEQALAASTSARTGGDPRAQSIAAANILAAAVDMLTVPGMHADKHAVERFQAAASTARDLIVDARTALPAGDPQLAVLRDMTDGLETTLMINEWRRSVPSSVWIEDALTMASQLRTIVAPPATAPRPAGDLLRAHEHAAGAIAGFAKAAHTSDDYHDFAETLPAWLGANASLASALEASAGLVPADILQPMRAQLLRFDDQVRRAWSNARRSNRLSERQEPQRGLAGAVASDAQLLNDLLPTRSSISV